MSFSYGDFPEMVANEEYQVEICLNDRHGPVGQKCRATLPCEVHRVHVGRATGGASEATGKGRQGHRDVAKILCNRGYN